MIRLIGDLNQRILIESEQRTPDASGGYTLTWQPVATVWASVTPLSAGEKWQSGQLGLTRAYRFTIRRRIDIDESQRLIWGSLALNIRAVTQQPNKAYTDILASLGDAV